MTDRTTRSSLPRSAEWLRATWQEVSNAAVWSYTDDWWTPSVDAVIEAMVEGRDPHPACDRLGRDRAIAAVALQETIDDLIALRTIVSADKWWRSRSVLVSSEASIIRAVALGWADVTAGAHAAADCIDPLTGLATPSYLRTRLRELYSGCERAGTDIGATFALVVVALARSRDLRGPTMTAMITVRERLYDVFSGGETLAATGPETAVALVARDHQLARRHAVLVSLLRVEGASTPASGDLRTWIEQLPTTYGSARELIAKLGR
jgi:GGDEF domain-containing protein